MRSDLLKVVICGAALALAGQSLAEGQLRFVKTRTFAGTTKLQIVGKGLKQPSIVKGDGNSTIFTFQAFMPGTGNEVEVGKDGLKHFRYYWYKSHPRLVRVQLWPENSKSIPTITKNAEGWLVSWNNVPPLRAKIVSPDTNVNTPPTAKPVEPGIAPLTEAVKTPAPAAPSGDPKAKKGDAKPKVTISVKPLPKPARIEPHKHEHHSKPEAKKPEPRHQEHPQAESHKTEIKVQPAQAVKPEIKHQAKHPARTLTHKTEAQVAAPRIKPTITKVQWAGTGTTPLTDALATDAKPKSGTPKIKVRKVSLDFVNTDVVQILKALAMQSRVNIVTSPDVKGLVTVSLADVTVNEALDLVTALTGLSYDIVGNTYVVASKDKITSMVRAMSRTAALPVESKVVPIYSGEGTQIKAAVLRTVPAETGDGTFEVVLPSEETKVQKTVEDTQGGAIGGDPTKNGGDANKTKVESTATTTQKDLYVVVMGSPARVAEVARVVSKLDNQFCMTMGVEIPKSTAMVSKFFPVRGGSASELMKAVAGDKTKIGNVDISATPASSKSDQAIVLHGRENEVNSVLQTLAALDSNNQVGDAFLMYDVKYADPRSLREALISQVPGLRATIPPASAGAPRLYEPGTLRTQSGDIVNPYGAPGTTLPPGAQTTDPKVGKETGDVTEGLASPFIDMERAAVPMRLLLRGSAEQLDAAKTYLQVVDIAPKQIALELRVMELSKEDALRIGIDWNIFTGGAVSLIHLNQSLSPAGSNTGKVHIGGRNWGADITATLDNTIDRQRLIARPNLLAIDGRESEIFVGDIVRYVASKSTNPTTGEINLTIQEVPVGVRLAVMPRVGGDGSLTMDLRPVVSSITGYLDAGGGVKIPQTSSRIAQSTVNIMSGETIAIGGLIQDTDTRSVSKVPFLADLPIIGKLFQRTDNSKVRREVVFFLTAREVSARDRQNAADPREGERRNPTEMPPLKKNGGG